MEADREGKHVSPSNTGLATVLKQITLKNREEQPHWEEGQRGTETLNLSSGSGHEVQG